MTDKTMTATVAQIGRMHFEGNIIPQSWYRHILMENGKVDLAGCTILADIVYWYRPSEVRDEETGRVIGWKRKFRGDRLQRSYEQQGEMLGLTKDQARDAMQRLCEAGLIIITVENGVRFANGGIGNGVVFVEPVADAIAAITYRPIDAEVGQDISLPAPVENPTQVGKESEGNTEITTETSAEITAELAAESENLKTQEPVADEPNAYAAYFSVYVQHLSLQRYGELVEIFNEFPLEWQKEALKRAFSKEQESDERWFASRRLSYAIPMLREWKTHGAIIEKSKGRGSASRDQANNFKVVRTADGGFF